MDILLSSSSSNFFAVRVFAAPSKLPFAPLHSPRSTSQSISTISAVQIEEKPQTIELKHADANKHTKTSVGTVSTSGAAQGHNRAQRAATEKMGVQRPLVRSPSLPAAFCDALDDLINVFIDPPVLRPAMDPRYVLHDNFYPVDELPPTPCPVVRGAIPRCLAGGAYIRNGPNPQYLPRGPHHLFEGDGMLHSLLLPSGGDGRGDAILCSRYVRTYRYLLERDSGSPLLPSIFAAFQGVGGVARSAVIAARVLTGQLNPVEGIGLANTSLVYFGERLYALGESDLPYAVRISKQDGEVATLGRHDFDGRLLMSMTAHPKKDPVTGELFAFRYGPVPPFVTYFRFDAYGNKTGPDVPIFSMTQPSFLHDFAITERYAVFPDIQIVMKPMEMLVGGGAFLGTDQGKVTRLGVLPRYSNSEVGIRWVDVPGFNPLHVISAWDEGDNELVVVAANILPVEHALERMEKMHACVEMVRVDLRGNGRVVSRTPLSAGNLEFGVMHPGYVGRKNRYAYLGVGNPLPKMGGVVKLDLEMAGRGDCTVARRDFGPGCFGGEPIFVPKGEMPVGKEAEDEGYLVSYVHDEGSGESRFLVMDAQSPELEIVAEVLLPRRVPYGFHGIFVTQAELRAQRPL